MNVHAVSSLKLDPLDEFYTNLEYHAFESWLKTFDRIHYLNDPNPRFQSDKTTFVPSEDPPRIKDLVQEAACSDGITVLLNADIWVRETTADKLRELVSRGKICGMSNRYNFDPHQMNVEGASFHPGGLDMFFGTQEVWQDVLTRVPDVFRIGITIWDAWMMNYLPGRFQKQFINFTGEKLMAHPLTAHLKQAEGSQHNANKAKLSQAIGDWYTAHKNTDPVMIWRGGKKL